MSNQTPKPEKPKRLPSLTTEEEARSSKMCPFTAGRDMPRHCVASSCAAWTWITSPYRPKEETGQCGLVNFEGSTPFPSSFQEPPIDNTPYGFLNERKAPAPAESAVIPGEVI